MKSVFVSVFIVITALKVIANDVVNDNLSEVVWNFTCDFRNVANSMKGPRIMFLYEKYLPDVLHIRIGVWKSELLDDNICHIGNSVKRLWLEVTDDAVASLYLENATGEFISSNNSERFFFSDMSFFFGEKQSGVLMYYGIVDDYMYVLLSPHKIQKKIVFRRFKQKPPLGILEARSKIKRRYLEEDILEDDKFCRTNLCPKIAGIYCTKNLTKTELAHGVNEKILSINRDGVMQDIYFIDGKYCFNERETPENIFSFSYNFAGVPAIGDGIISFVRLPPMGDDRDIVLEKISQSRKSVRNQTLYCNSYSNSLFHAREKGKNWINEPNAVYTLTTNMVFNKDDMEIMRVWERLEADNELKEIYLKKIIVN